MPRDRTRQPITGAELPPVIVVPPGWNKPAPSRRAVRLSWWQRFFSIIRRKP